MVASSWVGPVFSWLIVQAIRKLSSSMPSASVWGLGLMWSKVVCVKRIGLVMRRRTLLLTTMDGVALRLIPLSGVKGVGPSSARWILGLMSILPLSLGLVVSYMGLGFQFMVVLSVARILLLGRKVSSCPRSLFPFFLTLHWPSGADDLGHFGFFIFRGRDPF